MPGGDSVLDAVVGRVRELELDDVAVPVLGGRTLLTVADVADLPVERVVPREREAEPHRQTDRRIGRRLDQLVRRHGGRVVDDRVAAAAGATRAAQIWQDA